MAPGEAAAELVPARERGATRIADRVIAKIAAQAAREVLRKEPEAPLVPAERAMPHATASVVRAHAQGGGASRLEARVSISVELGYPSDIGARCRAVRREVTERVRSLAGMEVPEVSVSVERLHSVQTRHADRERVR